MGSARLHREQTKSDPALNETQKPRRGATIASRRALTLGDQRPSLRLSHTFGQSHKSLAHPLQAKLTINEPNDQYEKEADRVAEQVMRMPDTTPRLQRKCGCSASGGACECENQLPLVQRRTTPANTPLTTTAPSVVHDVLGSPGQPLDQGARAFFEQRFGQSFSDVRVHTDAKAAESAEAVSAMAYTVGHDIAFGEGRYAPNTNAGRQLLAHELSHVVQQSSGPRTAEHPLLLQRSCTDGRCESCAGGRRDFWVTVFFRRRANAATMANLRAEINGAKAILSNCCLDLKFDFDWRLLRGPAVFPAGTARPAGDPLGGWDYPTDAETLGEGSTFSGARGVPMLVVDDVPGSGGGVTMIRGLDAEYTGRNYFAIPVNQTAPNPSCNSIAHELWHMTGAPGHDPADGPITACTSDVVSLTYCNALRNMVAPRGDFPLPAPAGRAGATRMA